MQVQMLKGKKYAFIIPFELFFIFFRGGARGYRGGAIAPLASPLATGLLWLHMIWDEWDQSHTINFVLQYILYEFQFYYPI